LAETTSPQVWSSAPFQGASHYVAGGFILRRGRRPSLRLP